MNLGKLVSALLFISLASQAQNNNQFPVDNWQTLAQQQSAQQDNSQQEKSSVERLNHKTQSANIIQANIDLLTNVLLNNSNESVVISLPMPNGAFAEFRLNPSLVMANELAEKYPNIRTFRGYQIDNPDNNGRFDITPHGFHGVFVFDNQKVFIEPKFRNNNQVYSSYFRKNALPLNNKFRQLSPIVKQKFQQGTTASKAVTQTKAMSSTKITYRIAISAIAEYTQFHGGTKEDGLAALVTLVNRLNEVYERDLHVSLELVANNDEIIFTDADTDPFNNNDDDIDLNKAVIDDAIGNDNYDIGHVVTTGGGGLAGLGVVCDNNYKADGLTGLDSPVNDAFAIDYVAHEVGHQFGADHTFNGTTSGCDGNRVADSAYEPGSATTIMGYAGICGEQSIQNNSDAYFHSRSYDQMTDYLSTTTGSSCGTQEVESNSAPTVDAGQDYTIPANTPFILTGTATDIDGDTLSYSWEQADLGDETSSKSADMTDNGSGPLFRVWEPMSESTRTFPQISDILANTTTYGEALPTTSRDMNFRLMVRDNQGNVSFDATQITVESNTEGFSVSQPTTDTSWTEKEQTVIWNTADTQQSPVSCDAVDILLSTNSGETFSETLLSATSNDGEAEVSLPTLSTSTARIKVRCSDNIFFAINEGDIAINVGSTALTPVITGQQNLTLNEDNSLTLAVTHFSYETSLSIDSLVITEGANYEVNGQTITPAENFNGSLSVSIQAVRSELTSEIFTANVTVSAVNDAPTASNDTISVAQDSGDTTVSVLDNDSDIEGDNLTILSVNYSGSGSAVMNNNKIVYSPASGFSGTDSVNYTVTDGNGGNATASIRVTVVASTDNSTSNSSGGGSMSYFLVFALLLLSCRPKIGENNE